MESCPCGGKPKCGWLYSVLDFYEDDFDVRETELGWECLKCGYIWKMGEEEQKMSEKKYPEDKPSRQKTVRIAVDEARGRDRPKRALSPLNLLLEVIADDEPQNLGVVGQA